MRFRDFITGLKQWCPAGLRFPRYSAALGWLGLTALLFAAPWSARAQQPADSAPKTPSAVAAASSEKPQSDATQSGVIRGAIVDKTGTLLGGVHIKLTHEGQSVSQEATSGEDGQFEMVNVAPGMFQLTFTAANYKPQIYSGTLHSGEMLAVPEVTLELAMEVTEVRVQETQVEIAQEQIREQEKQRVLGVIPNFYVTYEADAVPLNTKQKFELAWKYTFDPATFVITGGTAGLQQATNSFSAYGQGAQGYAKRYAANYADTVIGTFIGSAILPSVMKQDPRYFYKGTGSIRSRAWYAIYTSVVCKGDNGHWQVCYSALLGSLISGGISNAYYPESDRGVGLTFENFGIGIASTAGANLLQEFVLRKFTPHAGKTIDPATVTP